MSAVVVSTGLPNCREGRLSPVGAVDPSWMRVVAESAEQLGYESLWLNEFPQTEPGVLARFDDPPNYYDMIVTIAALAERTKRIRFFTSTIVLPLHEPILLAKQFATLDAFSDGRVTLGIGLGGTAEEYRQLHGEAEKANRGQMMDEYLPAIRALWARDRKSTYHGQYVSFAGIEVFPKPTQDPLPIYMAGTADGVYRRIAQYGEGWIDTFLMPDALRQAISTIRLYWNDAGRVGQPAVARQFYLSLADSDEEARDNVAASVPAPRPAPPPREGFEMNLIGTPDRVRDRILEYVEAGVTEVSAIFFAPDIATTLRQMNVFAERIAPALRAVSIQP
jgi:probable F420-dependent oxidoreductase